MNNKPAHLYHGSNKGINGALTPQPQQGDANGLFPEGKRDLVFATHDKELAALYSLKTQHMLQASAMEEPSGKRNVAIFRDYEGWKHELASARAELYTLPPDSFINTKDKDGQPSVEWQSKIEVNPIQVVRQTPEAVMQVGTQLFFVDANVPRSAWHDENGVKPARDEQSSFMGRLHKKFRNGQLPTSFNTLHLAKELQEAGLLKHLNAEMGINPIDLPKSPHAAVIREDVQWLAEKVKLARLSSAVNIPKHVIADAGVEVKPSQPFASRKVER